MAAAFFAEHGRRQRVFCASMADVFDNAVDPQWRSDLFALIDFTPNLDWLLLTKRIGNANQMIFEASAQDQIPANVWLGATICNQEEADRDIPKLLAVPAAKRFLSIEPMLEAIDLTKIMLHENNTETGVELINYPTDKDALSGKTFTSLGFEYASNKLDWIICGGESGHGARPMHPDWARRLRDQCKAAGVQFFFKQWGEWREPLEGEEFDTSMGRAAKPQAFILSETGTVHCFENTHVVNGRAVIKVGKKPAGRLLDGVEHNGVPV